MSGDDEAAKTGPGPAEPGQPGPGQPGPGRAGLERAGLERAQRAPTPGEPGADSAQQARTVAGAGDSSGERETSDLAALNNTYFQTSLTFNGQVVAPNGTFGTAGGPAQDETSRRARTGKLPEEEASALCEHFAPPPLLPDAAAALRRDHVVVLAGAAGLGKRASAVRLLVDVGAKPLEVVAPTLTLEELAKQQFDGGHGYLVEDWQQAPGTDASDFSWRVLRDHVMDSTAYLVLTAADGKAGRSVAQFGWQAPTPAEVLTAYLASQDTAGATDRIAEVAGKIPGTYGVAAVASIAQRLASGADQAAVLEELSDDPGRYVSEWLAADERTDDEIQAVTTLSFAAGQSERLYELILKRLEHTLREIGVLPDPADSPPDKPDGDEAAKGGFVPRASGLRGTRTRRRAEGLLVRADGRVRFLGEEPRHQYLYHRHTLEELWREYDMSFWTAVRGWLADLIGDTTLRDVQLSVAVGLTLLAFVALDEVEDAYLHPWAAGERAWSGQATAVYVLWLMSRDDSLAPVALRIATDWVNTGDPVCQWTAGAALSGELGGVYPEPAAARLWHLVGQWKDVPTKAVIALANLFATLTREREGQDAYQVLELLRERMSRASRDDSEPGRPSPSWREDRRNRERAHLCILSVLAVRDPGTKQPSITSFLYTRPERLGLVAELWAEVIRNRPHRKRALVALLDAVRGFEHVSDDPEASARALGDALTEALPEAEHQPLKVEFTNILARSKRPEGHTAATVQALVDALEHLKPADVAAG